MLIVLALAIQTIIGGGIYKADTSAPLGFDPESGLLAYWKLDEASGNAIDDAGANDLTETSGTIASSATAIKGTSRDFEFLDSELFLIDDNADLSGGDTDFIMMAHVYMETVTSTPVIISKGVGEANDGGREYELFYHGTNNRFEFHKYASTTPVTLGATTFGAASPSTWYTLFAWHSATDNQIGIWVNDTSNTTATSTGVNDSTRRFRLGATTDVGGSGFDGLIDEVAFWRKNMTEAERDWLYNGGTGRTLAEIQNAVP
jgi:hypothetical protein